MKVLLEALVEMHSPSCVSADVLSTGLLVLKAGLSGPQASLCQKYASYTQALCFCLCLAPDTGTCAQIHIRPDDSTTESLRGGQCSSAVEDHSLCCGVLQAQWPRLSRPSMNQWCACECACNRISHDPIGIRQTYQVTDSPTAQLAVPRGRLPEHACVMATR